LVKLIILRDVVKLTLLLGPLFMNDSGIALKDVFCDEELVVSTRGRRHGVFVLAAL
jgi:hypothetical protein